MNSFQMGDVSLLLTLLSLKNHISIWLIEDLYPDYSGTTQDCVINCKGAPTEDVAMLKM